MLLNDDIAPLGTVSEIARQALKQLIADNSPAVPPLYEKAFYKKAMEMGESHLVDHLLNQLPTGQAATILIEKLAMMMGGLDQNMQFYREGLDVHNAQISGEQEKIKRLVDPTIWTELEKHLTGVLEANTVMKERVLEAEQRIKDQEQHVTKLQHKIRLDPLTGALNRYALDEDLSAEFSRSKRYKRPLSLVMADIDFFKKINDTYGHSTGDEVLKTFVMLVRRVMRDVDAIYRYGGEEFVILLPETGNTGAMIAADRLRASIERHVLTHKSDKNLQITITVSMGVSTFTAVESSYKTLLDRADEALYKAKENGRNRVENAFKPEG